MLLKTVDGSSWFEYVLIWGMWGSDIGFITGTSILGRRFRLILSWCLCLRKHINMTKPAATSDISTTKRTRGSRALGLSAIEMRAWPGDISEGNNGSRTTRIRREISTDLVFGKHKLLIKTQSSMLLIIIYKLSFHQRHFLPQIWQGTSYLSSGKDAH